MKTFWDDLLAFNETVATDFPCTHVYMRHTHTHQGWYLGGWMDLCMLSLLERIIYHSLSHSVSCKKFPRVKLDIAVACEKKKKSLLGESFSFLYWRDTVKMKEIVPTHCGWNRSLHVALLFVHLTCEEESRSGNHVQKVCMREKRWGELLLLPVRERSTEPRMEMSRAEADLLIVKLH